MILILLSSCSGGGDEIAIERQTYTLDSSTPVVIQVENGRIALSNSNTGQVILSGSARSLDPDQPLVSLESNGLFITSDNVANMINIDLQIPPGYQVVIDTYGAEVRVQDFKGILDVTSAAGDIGIESMEGKAILRANRGDVVVESSSGEYHLPGNYGLLSLKDVSGVVDASTIMGTIRYQGEVAASDKVKLETDHGPVEVWLDTDSNVTVAIRTTTGVTDCVISGLSPDGAGCKGQLGNGEGVLQVRTVSGGVDVRPIP